MADKKIIAVVGSTGSQGGGLARRFSTTRTAGSPSARSRAIPTRTRPRRSPAKGAEVVKADLDDVESLKKAFAGAYGVYARHELLGALLRREGKGAGEEHRRRREGRRRQARHLVDARRHAQADEARRQADADAAGEVPRAALRREGRGQRVLRGPAGHVSRDVVLLGQPLHVRPRAEEGRRRQLQLGVPDGQREAGRASPPRTSARSRTASSRPASSTSARPSASPART